MSPSFPHYALRDPGLLLLVVMSAVLFSLGGLLLTPPSNPVVVLPIGIGEKRPWTWIYHRWLLLLP